MYTTPTIPIRMQHDIVDNAKAAVKAYVIEKYPTFFTKEDIEDIVGNTNYKACRSIGSYNTSWALSTWVGKIARNCVLDAVDYKMKRLPISAAMYAENEDGEEYCCTNFSTYRGDEFEADRDITLEEFNEAVDSCTSSMSERDKAFFEMLKDGKTPAEMAKEMGCNANVAAMRSCYIRQGLKQPLDELAREYGIYCKKLVS